MSEQEDLKRIDASPTKDFFISMLVRDIELVDAIADLVDNCVDGARRIRPKGDYDGLWVRIEANPEHFRIADNCGGIDIVTARNYAFRFGRPKGMKTTPHSVGQFGIGMKRALFKLGTNFTVESKTVSSNFSMTVDVNEWKKDDEPESAAPGKDNNNGDKKEDRDRWAFRFDTLREDLKVPPEKTGTIIEVTELNEGVRSEFGLENFRIRLVSTLEAKHQYSLNAGLAITLNKTPLKFTAAELLRSKELKPAYRELEYKPDKKTPVDVRLFAGLADSDPDSGGWYVFCNGRLVVNADKTIRTGWGEGHDITLPKYHNQYARFRGYAFFDSDDAALLPWNTSKTDVALDSPTYQATRQQMISMTRPVIDFLNKVRQEERLAAETGERPLMEEIERAKPADLEDIKVQPSFIAPKAPPPPPLPEVKLISYRKPLEQINKVKKVLKARSLREIGEKTFQYFYDAECKG